MKIVLRLYNPNNTLGGINTCFAVLNTEFDKPIEGKTVEEMAKMCLESFVKDIQYTYEVQNED